eukprot:TRINITY_DN1950_c0_g1_i1.p1 TRINITY_DN1950_c0_g1~~TRINITY_DN1950_c0_g1_i1.p1  ORF type:complete len:527 (+),score=30.68 TRINITY_DN1950_c0_g1_i1:141-1721(+)
MCGIAATLLVIDREEVIKMLERTKHRGEDHSNIRVLKDFGVLGFNRLSIVDLTEHGNQPLSDPSLNYHVICNGEIYNHLPLRELFRDYAFDGHSDVEVILPLYERYQENCVKYLDGMFSFILVDLQRKNFLVARDPFGVKPLFYMKKGNGWIFASEMKAFVGSGVDMAHVVSFPPGSYMTREGKPIKYFNLRIDKLSPVNVELTKSIVTNAVKKRMMADVKIGTFLSGGIDSSIVTAVASKINPFIEAFTIGIKGSDDVEYAKMVAKHLNIKLNICYVDPHVVRDRVEHAIKAIESYSPVMVCESLLIMLVAETAKKYGFKVLLSGTGADESFVGYESFMGKSHTEVVEYGLSLLNNYHFTENRMLDLATMSQGIEAREPFLDPSVVEHAMSLPLSAKLKIEDGVPIEKYILRKAFEDILPREVLWRKKDPFFNGSGFGKFLDLLGSDITDEELEEAIFLYPQVQFVNKASLYLYKIYIKYYGQSGSERTMCGFYPYGDDLLGDINENGFDKRKQNGTPEIPIKTL